MRRTYDSWKAHNPEDELLDLEEPPQIEIVCDECGGEGCIEVAEIVSKWSDDPYACRVETCRACHGMGSWIEDHPGDRYGPSYDV